MGEVLGVSADTVDGRVERSALEVDFRRLCLRNSDEDTGERTPVRRYLKREEFISEV